MFYCNSCAKKNSWPQTGFKSRGKCEMCGQYATCNERKAAMLLPLTKKGDKS